MTSEPMETCDTLQLPANQLQPPENQLQPPTEAACDEALAAVFEHMCSLQKLERDRASEKLHTMLPSCSVVRLEHLLVACLSGLEDAASGWHALHGCLVTYRTVVELRGSITDDEETWYNLLQVCSSHLSHPEARIRIAVGELLGCLCALRGRRVYEAVEERLSTLISSSLQATEPDADDKLETASVTSRDSADVFANTASWTLLETCLRCLQQLVAGGQLPITDELLDVLLSALQHSNRFVRESVFVCVSAFLPALEGDEWAESDARRVVFRHGDALCDAIARGMDDNWSQVRMSASVAARRLLCGAGVSERNSQRFHPVLVPRICLSRYYVAEGVKLYNQRTWQLLAGERGRQLVERHLHDVVRYYLEATRAENHAVREAACYCVSELVKKLPQQSLAEHAVPLLNALLVCFQDDSWPVRDTACLAVGGLVAGFPGPCQSYMDQLYPLMFSNLHDNIPSVRQGAAESLAIVVRAYGAPALQLVTDRLRCGLEGVKDQPVEYDQYSDLEPVAEFGVVRRLRSDESSDKHTNQTMYSCGSLAPKLRGGGGCSASHHFRRPAQPWEVADGCVRLVSELAAVPACIDGVSSLLSAVSVAATHRHYTHHIQLAETLCRRLPVIATALGKRPFKTHLELFLDTIFYAIESDNQLTAEAGLWCAEQLSSFLGPGIFRGRVELHNHSYVSKLDRRLGCRRLS